MNGNKNVMIFGDSYSTYGGYIPQGYHAYYCDERKDAPIVRGVEKTWWKLVEAETGIQIKMNDSFSGSTVCNTVRESLSVESSFINRLDRYAAENFFAENRIDTVLIFGGTNDSWINAPVGEVKYSDWTAEDLKCVLPAFCYLIDRAKSLVEQVIVIVNSDLKAEISEGFGAACEANGIRCLFLRDVDKEKGHPTELGMEQIARQVAEYLQ